MEIETNPFAFLAFGAAYVSLFPAVAVLVVVSSTPRLRPHLPTVLAVFLVVAGVAGILAPLIATSGCGCEEGM